MHAYDEMTVEEAVRVLHAPRPDDTKYRRGVVAFGTGSERYPGAAVLGVEAALRCGVGMVRYLGSAPDAVLARRPEAVTAPGRVDAWVLGSGTQAADWVRPPGVRFIARVTASRAPCVLDAGALGLAVPRRKPGMTAPTLTVVTPHAAELARLLTRCGQEASPAEVAAEAADTCARAADSLGTVVLLKGATTHVAAPGGPRYSVTTECHWLATAGTGDVLAGILGALLAGAVVSGRGLSVADIARVAAVAAWLHARAAERASAAHAAGPVLALEVAVAVAAIVGTVLG